MASNEQLRLAILNEKARQTFYRNFTPGSTLTKEQVEDLGPEQVARVEQLVKDLLWASMERRSFISTCGVEAEELYLKDEHDMPAVETFLPDESSREDLEAAQNGVWAQVVRLIGERNMTNGIEIMDLYNEINQPYFRFTWLEACKAREQIQSSRLATIEEEIDSLGACAIQEVPDIEIVSP